MSICTDCAGEVETTEMELHMRVAHGVNYRRPEPAVQCDACAEGRHCERLQQLVEAAWRHGETAANG